MLRYAPPPPLTKWYIERPSPPRVVRLLVVFEVVRVAGHDHIDGVLLQQVVDARRSPASSVALIVAGGVERMAEDHHLELAAGRARAPARASASGRRRRGAGCRCPRRPGRTGRPGSRSRERAAAPAWTLVLAAQPRGLLDHAVDAGLGRRGQVEVGLAAGAHAPPAPPLGSRKLAVNDSRASYQSWLPGTA